MRNLILIFILFVFSLLTYSGLSINTAEAAAPGSGYAPPAGSYGAPANGYSPYAGSYGAPANGYSPPGYWAAPGAYSYGASPYIYQQAAPYSYYRSPYGYGSSYNYGTPIEPPQPYNGAYNLSFNGRNVRLWRSPSGYYYPWVGGYNYTNYPIFIVPQGQSNPTPTLPPMRVLFSDLNNYLDEAKEKGKISEPDYQSLKRRANDLLSKEKSLAYEGGGSLDPDQEADIRRDVEELSGEVAHRVKP